MSRPLSEPIEITPMPEGLEVRLVSSEQVRVVWDAATEAFRDHWVLSSLPMREYQMFLEDPVNDPNLWMVAWDGDQVAGSVQNFLHRQENEEYHRKRGYTEGSACADLTANAAWRPPCSPAVCRCSRTWAWTKLRWASTHRI